MLKVTPNCQHFHIYGIDDIGRKESLARDVPENRLSKMHDALQDRVNEKNLYNYLRDSRIVSLEGGCWRLEIILIIIALLLDS